LRISIGRRAVSALCALALVLVTFAHRPAPADQPRPEPQLALWLALGGPLDDLCRSGDRGKDAAAHPECPACIIAKSIAAGPACPALAGLVVWTSRRVVWPEATVPASHGPRAPPCRGPPVLRSI
jgi:hypothetical protein